MRRTASADHLWSCGLFVPGTAPPVLCVLGLPGQLSRNELALGVSVSCPTAVRVCLEPARAVRGRSGQRLAFLASRVGFYSFPPSPSEGAGGCGGSRCSPSPHRPGPTSPHGARPP